MDQKTFELIIYILKFVYFFPNKQTKDCEKKIYSSCDTESRSPSVDISRLKVQHISHLWSKPFWTLLKAKTSIVWHLHLPFSYNHSSALMLLPMLSSSWMSFASCRPSSQIGTLNTTPCLLLLPRFEEAMQSPCNGFHPTATCLATRLLTLWQRKAQQRSKWIGLPATLRWRPSWRTKEEEEGTTTVPTLNSTHASEIVNWKHLTDTL